MYRKTHLLLSVFAIGAFLPRNTHANSCTDVTSGSFVPYPYDCTKFIECLNGEEAVLECGYGKSWNDNKKVCDENTEENCIDSSVTPASVTTPPPTTTTTLATTTPDPRCEGVLSGSYIKDQWDCTVFILCVGGQANIIDCQYGQSWNDERKTCDENTEENCKDSSVTPASVTTPPPTTTTTLATTTPDPRCDGILSGSYIKDQWDCTVFIECVGGQANVISCGYGQSWNDQRKTCDENTEENCKDSSVSPASVTTPPPTTTTTVGTTTADVYCQDELNGSYLAYPDDCTKFMVCINGKGNVLDCDEGLSWNDQKKTCDDNTEENCQSYSWKRGEI